MKKYLLFALMAVMSLAANAQQFKLNKSKKSDTALRKAPAKAAGIDGTDIWGYYLGDGSDFRSLGVEQPSSYRVAIYVPGDGVLKGAKIRGLNIPMEDYGTDASGWVSTGLTTSTYVASKTIGDISGRWTILEFDEPIEIPASGLYAGYTFTSQGNYPIAIADDYAAGGLYLATTATGKLTDYSSAGYGISGLQVFVEGMNLPENGASIYAISTDACVVGGKGEAAVYLESDSKNGVNNVEYTLTVNGVQTTGTKTLSKAIPAGLNKSGYFTIEYDAPAEIGAFDASIAITKVNGANNEVTEAPVPFTVSTVSRVVPRMTVVEEYTGTQCGYCPRGWVGMEAVKNNQSDKALVIAWHNYNSSDAMYQANYAGIHFNGAPGCWVDRKVYPDPYYGSDDTGIMNTVSALNQATPTVDVKLKANFVDETNKEVKVSANTEFLTNTKGYTIAFALTADDLKGTTTAWKQSNYYYEYAAASAGILESMPELAEFCAGGSMGKSSVALTFNDALIGSTYDATGKSTVAAFTTGKVGDKETSEATIAMPTKPSLVSKLNYEKIYATVLVIDENGAIANAARVRVLGAGEGEGGDEDDPVIDIDGAKVSDMTEEIQLMGENMSPNAKYVVGMNFATYAPAAWNVETNEIIEFPDYEEGAFHAANSNGIFVGDDGNHAIKADAAGNVTPLYRFEGEEIETEWGPMSTGDAGSAAYAISEDGKTIAGYYFDSSYNTTPCIWTENNTRIDLPLPTMEEAGFEVNGGQVRYMTPDAKILVGYLIDNMATWPACIWRQNESGGYDYDIICKDYWEEDYEQGKPYMVFNPAGISANGEWLALTIQGEYNFFDFDAPIPPTQAARLNLTNGNLEILTTDMELAPTGIANDGATLVYAGGNDMMGRAGYVWEAGSANSTVSVDDILSALPQLEELASNTPCALTADGKFVQGFGIDGENIFSYVVDFDKAVGINTAKVENKTAASGRIFNINGQQVRNMNGRGLYIINGKKILVK